MVSGKFPDRRERPQSRRNPDQVFERPAVIFSRFSNGIFVASE
ncbi:hypothetical protein AB0D27_25075 [Streptomyces sp. NPDC048415]